MSIRDKSQVLFERGQKVMPLGVNSNYRFYGDTKTLYLSHAKGAYSWDVDGNKLIDYRLGYGPIILGYAYDEVDDKVSQAIRKGVTYALSCEYEIDAAERIVQSVPSVDQVRMVNSGTEATMYALRLARAYTGREKFIKFEGGYHGSHDYFLYSLFAPPGVYGNRRDPIPIPTSSGIPKCIGDLVKVIPWNDPDVLVHTLKSFGHQMAAIMMEINMGNCGSIDPAPGFLELIREECDRYDIVLIFDEVKSGFRMAMGGGEEVYGVRPDLTTFGKAMANGYPVAAYGGKQEIMQLIGDGVQQGGTYSGNTLSAAATSATLEILSREPVLETIAKRGLRLQTGLKTIFKEAGIPCVISGPPSFFHIAFGIEEMKDGRDFSASDFGLYQRLAESAFEKGVMFDPNGRASWYLCYSHSEADIDQTLNVIQDATKSIR